MKKITLWLVQSVALTISAFAQSSIYQESFESTTGSTLPSGWNSVFGQSVVNPLIGGSDQSTRVLSFSSARTGSDTFSSFFDLSPYKNTGQRVLVTFNFLSSATINHAGVIGLSSGTNSPQWFGGSPAAALGVGVNNIFSGSGTWTTVTIDVTPFLSSHTATELQASRVAFERWNDTSVASTTPVYFDDIAVIAIPSIVTVPDTSGRLINLSTLGAGGFTMGFVISGTSAKRMLVRAVGPALATFGVSGAATQTSLTVFSGSTAIGTNSGWSTAANASQIAAVGGAFPLPTGSADSAVLATLNPGSYTARASGNGAILLEVYEAP